MYGGRLVYLSRRLETLFSALDLLVDERPELHGWPALPPSQEAHYRQLIRTSFEAGAIQSRDAKAMQTALANWTGQPPVTREVFQTLARDLNWLCSHPAALQELGTMHRNLYGPRS